MTDTVPLKVHLVRHGEVASHRGDVPVTETGLAQAETFGRRLGGELGSGERIFFLHAPTRRARETAAAIRGGVEVSLPEERRRQLELHSPLEDPALRNPDVYAGGVRVEMVSTPEALAEQTPSELGAQQLSQHPFFGEFFRSPDRIGYWVEHPDPPGEHADAVARRLLAFTASLMDLPRERPRRYVCVTHSPLVRAFLRRYLPAPDPGEPDYLEAVDLSFSTGKRLEIDFRGRRNAMTLG